MASIAIHQSIEPAAPGGVWPAVAARTREWLVERGIPERDAIVLVPFAQLLPLARAAFGQRDGWQPQIATTQSLAGALGPAAAPGAGQLSFDTPIDRLAAARLLRTQPIGIEWARRDPMGFDQRVAALVDAAHELARAAAQQAPEARNAWWDRARGLLSASAGPATAQRTLARIALEWAAAGAAPATDRLFSLRPRAWVAVQCGGEDPLVRALLSHADCPTLILNANPPLPDPFAALAPRVQASNTVCDGFEDEAQSACALILSALARPTSGNLPIALVAQDRAVVRRTRALLERAGVRMRDETGWKLSTTRAAAFVMGLLRAAAPQASTDALLEWLKSDALGDAHARALSALEIHCRRNGIRRRSAVDPVDLREDGQALWSAIDERLKPLSGPSRQSLADWLGALRQALFASGNRERLEADAAGRQVLVALHLLRVPAPGSAIEQVQQEGRLSLRDFTDWVDTAFESASFLPEDAGDAQVVILPLTRAMLRPFSLAVMPGTDEKRLGTLPAPDPLLPDALRRELNMSDATRQRELQALAMAHLLAASPVCLLRRRLEGSEPLAPSALVELLDRALRRAGRGGLAERQAPFAIQEIAPKPVMRPLPTAADALPPALSASSIEALRTCPYRFFALVLMRLREDDELDAGVQKRDYGTWLHALLLRFHMQRSAGASESEETVRLLELAREEHHLDPAELLPFITSFERLAPRYVAWLHRRDAQGWRFSEGETEHSVPLAGVEGLQLRGRIDRIDVSAQGVQLLDYKTGSSDLLKKRVSEPLEDTQLAFYAALLGPTDGQPMSAAYLALDEGKAPTEVEHPDVAATARVLVEGLSADLQAVRGGAAMPALGEGDSCTYCAARGLCRRDHWPDSDEVMS